MSEQTVKYKGCDKNGITRVFGEAKQPDVAYTECQRAVQEYVEQRPDTGPVSSWFIYRAP